MPSTEQILAEIWRRGAIGDILFHSGQRHIDEVYRNAPGAVVVLNISRQWGKTYYGVTKAVQKAITSPGCQVRIGAAFESDLSEFIEPAFEKIFDAFPEHLHPRYLKQKKRYVFPNGPNPKKPYYRGSTIKLVGLDKKPNGLRGNTIDLIILDEAGFINRLDYLHTSVIVPLTTHRPDAKILLLSTPPETPDHPFWDFVERAKLDNSYAEFTIDENPLLTPKDIARIEKEMGGRHTTGFQREYLCKKIIETERALVPEWSEALSVREVERPTYFKYLHTYEFLDTGVRHLTVELLGYYDFPRATLVIEDEIVLKGHEVTTRNIKEKTEEKEKDLGYFPYRRIADNNNLILINDLASEGLPFGATNKDSLKAMVNKMRLFVKDGRLEVLPKCKILIGTLNSGLWNEKRDKFAESKVFGHYDAIAALMYGIRNLDESTNPVPPEIQNPWLRHEKEKSLTETGRTMQKAFTGKNS